MEVYQLNNLDFRKSNEGDFLIVNSEDAIRKASQLKITNIEINDSLGSRFQNLAFLSELNFIEKLSIVAIRNIDISHIHHLSNLRYLNLTKDFDQVIDFEKFPLLKFCQFFWNKKIKNINRALLLEELILHHYKKDDLGELSGFSALKKLSIIQSGLHSLSGIEKLHNLEHLELHYLKKLPNLDGLQSLNLMKNLTFEYCPDIKDLTPLEKLSDLESLGIHDCKGINSLRPIRDLKKLQIIYLSGNTNILDGDMTPLMNRKDASFGTRRHYSHTAEEIDKINGTVRPKQTWDW